MVAKVIGTIKNRLRISDRAEIIFIGTTMVTVTYENTIENVEHILAITKLFG